MRAKIRSEMKGKGYCMIAILADGRKEYPQEGIIYKSRKSLLKAAKEMYSAPVWQWNNIDRTIKID